ncbi:NAD-dependent deacetylase [Camelimonas abortus]|uniref:protein acetyllysine N-acetyltransferase n=2 Tax=Camelimonas abortus TaxID=1017184 RepID=A0ABV7LD38_9HYPH
MLRNARRIVGFTGAGISTECGVPDFRSPDSPWLKHAPIDFSAFISSPEARREAWRRKFAMDDIYGHARPGRGHRVMAHLCAAGRMAAVITQNIDGLHQAAGTPPGQVIELHGNGSYARCLECGLRHELADIRPKFESTGEPPVCDSCGGIVKTATISFGQAMPEREMRRAQELAMDCDVFLVAGSSLVVHPAASLPLIARQSGARVIILNRTPTPLDDAATLVIHADIGDALEPLLRLN